MKRKIQDYLDTLDDTDTVGRQHVAEAIYVARRDDPLDEPTPDDLRPIVRDLPDRPIPSGRARPLMAAYLLREAAHKDPRDYDPRRELKAVRDVLDLTQTEAAKRVSVHQVSWARWESASNHRTPDDVARGEMLDWADELEADGAGGG